MKLTDLFFEEERVAYENILKALDNSDKQGVIKNIDYLVDRLAMFQDAVINQHEEFETETHIVTREAFWSYEGEIRYGYCVFEWTGNYEELPDNLKKIMPDFKKKEWREIFHCTSTEKQELNKQYIEEVVKLHKLAVKRGKKNGNK